LTDAKVNLGFFFEPRYEYLLVVRHSGIVQNDTVGCAFTVIRKQDIPRTFFAGKQERRRTPFRSKPANLAKSDNPI
jgi:hypothetical protein